MVHVGPDKNGIIVAEHEDDALDLEYTLDTTPAPCSEIGAHFAQVADTLRRVPTVAVQEAVRRIVAARARGALVFVAGNGGSAAQAAHLVCDLQKVCGVRALCLSDNAPLVTAWSNDESYSGVFVQQLLVLAKAGDVLVLISCSGASSNIVRAHRDAVRAGIEEVSIFGAPKRGNLPLPTDCGIVIPAHDYAVIEDVAAAVCHAIVKAVGHA